MGANLQQWQSLRERHADRAQVVHQLQPLYPFDSVFLADLIELNHYRYCESLEQQSSHNSTARPTSAAVSLVFSNTC